MNAWRVRGLLLAMALVLVATPLSVALSTSGGVDATVKDEAGRPLADAVVFLASTTPASPPRVPAAVMDQQDKTFVPHVLPVAVGTPVTFPNRDNIRHHVYSFSSAKKFELPLYIGTPAAPVVFDRPGPVVLGCNIHDWMVGYIYVVPTPYFAKSAADGRARLLDVPPGGYDARVWHPRMRAEPEKIGKPVTVAPGDPGQVAFVLSLKAERRAPQRPAYESGSQS
jgi:plastocyanin